MVTPGGDYLFQSRMCPTDRLYRFARLSNEILKVFLSEFRSMSDGLWSVEKIKREEAAGSHYYLSLWNNELEPSRQQHTAHCSTPRRPVRPSHSIRRNDGRVDDALRFFYWVLTVRSRVEWVMGLGHISVVDHATNAGASQIRHRPPSRMSRSRLHSEQNTCGVRDSCVWHSTHPDPRKRKITIK